MWLAAIARQRGLPRCACRAGGCQQTCAGLAHNNRAVSRRDKGQPGLCKPAELQETDEGQPGLTEPAELSACSFGLRSDARQACAPRPPHDLPGVSTVALPVTRPRVLHTVWASAGATAALHTGPAPQNGTQPLSDKRKAGSVRIAQARSTLELLGGMLQCFVARVAQNEQSAAWPANPRRWQLIWLRPGPHSRHPRPSLMSSCSCPDAASQPPTSLTAAAAHQWHARRWAGSKDGGFQARCA